MKTKNQNRDIIEELVNSVPVNIEALIRSAGIELNKNASQDEIRQGVNRNNIGEIRNENGVYKILVLGSDHYYRKRFTMAHELGHFVLHREKIDKAGTISDSENFSANFSENKITQEEERDASDYAAKILMPEDKIREIFKETRPNKKDENETIDEMSKMFQVSPKAMKLRLYLLELISNY